MLALSTLSSLSELETVFKSDVLLPLAKGNNPVFGEGPDHAKVLAIGEAPGAEENRLGRPFVGRSGQLLRRSLVEAGLDLTRDIYITNVVKHRPPENRDPTPEEIEAYRPYLDRQLTLISPSIILTLGRFSMNKFLPTARISQVHGQTHWLTLGGKKVMLIPMFHPAAALRGTTVMRLFQADFNLVKSALDYLAVMGELPVEAKPVPTVPSSPQTPTSQISLI